MPGNSAYRFAMAMVCHDLTHKDGPTSQYTYSKGEEEIIKAAMKKTGERALKVSNKGSTEPKNTNNTSPVAKIKKNKYGVDHFVLNCN